MKEYVFLGSSVTYGSASGGYSMCEYVRDTMGVNVTKWAVSGTTLVDTDESSYVARMLKEYGSKDICDLFVCQLSTNDAGKNLPLGRVSASKDKADLDTSTVLGAIEFIIAAAKEKWDCPVAFYTGTRFESENYQKMVDALLVIAEKWGIGVLDLWNDPEMNAVTAEDYQRYMSDPVHPTYKGYQDWWGPKFVSFIRENI